MIFCGISVPRMASAPANTGSRSRRPARSHFNDKGERLVSTNTALLVIDVQVGLVDGGGREPAYTGEQILMNIKHVLTAARAAETTVIYVQHDGDSGGRLEPGSPG